MTLLTLHAANGTPLAGRALYSHAEHSIRFVTSDPTELSSRLTGRGRTSIEIGTLQLEVDISSGRILFVWGLHPKTKWVRGNGQPMAPTAGEVFVSPDPNLEDGVALRLADVGQWESIYDDDTGWLRVTRPSIDDDDQQICIATDTVLGLRGGQLNSIWLRPVLEE